MAFPPEDGKQYYGRGPLQLSYNYNYGPMDQTFQKEYQVRDKDSVLKHPDILSDNGYKSMLASMWFYMTPQSPKPSMHEV